MFQTLLAPHVPMNRAIDLDREMFGMDSHSQDTQVQVEPWSDGSSGRAAASQPAINSYEEVSLYASRFRWGIKLAAECRFSPPGGFTAQNPAQGTVTNACFCEELFAGWKMLVQRQKRYYSRVNVSVKAGA